QLLEIRDQVRDSHWEREYERQVEERRISQQSRLNGPSLALRDVLSEDELLNYALMVSMDEHEQTQADRDLQEAIERSKEAVWDSGPSITDGTVASDSFPSRPIREDGRPPTAPSSAAGSAGSNPIPPASRSNHRARSRGSTPNSSRRSSYRDSYISLDDWDDDIEDEHPDARADRELYTPPMRGEVSIDQSMNDLDLDDPAVSQRRLVYGSSGRGGSWDGRSDYSPRSGNGAAAELLLRSPRLGPARGNQNRRRSSGNVVVAPRPEWDEDEELQYVLELSMVEK
ncbi:hypothetical protein HK104_006732, partial [Borealophlyctis nickersoniae]